MNEPKYHLLRLHPFTIHFWGYFGRVFWFGKHSRAKGNLIGNWYLIFRRIGKYG